jgi:hypothetical protein
MNESFLGSGAGNPELPRVQSPLKAARTYLQVVSTHQSPDNDGVERNARVDIFPPCISLAIGPPEAAQMLKDMWAEGEKS